MENNIKLFKEKLKKLTGTLDTLNISSSRIHQLRRTIYVLNKLLEKEIVSPYGPDTTIVKHSLN